MHRLSAAAFAGMLLLQSVIPMTATAEAAEVLELQSRRATLGLNADGSYVVSLWNSQDDVGTSSRWHLPLTAAELAELSRRLERTQEINDTAAPAIRRLPMFGGMYFDERREGILVVQLTQVDVSTERSLRDLLPSDAELEVRRVDSTYAQLQSSAMRVWDVWGSLTGLSRPYSVLVDVRQNQIVVDVDDGDLVHATNSRGNLESLLGVQIVIRPGVPAVAQSCPSRDDCDPIRGGSLARKGSTTGSPCTMAFHVREGVDEQFLTADHCATSGSNSWYHAGYGYLGGEKQHLSSQHYDAVRIQLPDLEATAYLYGDGPVHGWNWPTVGEIVWQNEGMSDYIGYGEVLNDWLSWSYGGYTLYGAMMEGIGGVGGDSGAPVYAWSYPYALARGINFGGLNGNGLFTRVGDVLGRFGVSLVTQ